MQNWNMVCSDSSYRHPRRGVVLVATLISLIFVVGLAGVLQTSALATTRTLRALMAEEQRHADTQALRELMRPIVAEAMLQFDGPHRLPLDGSPYPVVFDGRSYRALARLSDRQPVVAGGQPQAIRLTFER